MKYYFIVDNHYKVVCDVTLTKIYARFIVLLYKVFCRKEFRNNFSIVSFDSKSLYDVVKLPDRVFCPRVYHFDNLSCYVCKDKNDCKFCFDGEGEINGL